MRWALPPRWLWKRSPEASIHAPRELVANWAPAGHVILPQTLDSGGKVTGPTKGGRPPFSGMDWFWERVGGNGLVGEPARGRAEPPTLREVPLRGGPAWPCRHLALLCRSANMIGDY